MKKKLLLGVLIILSVFFITGCGKEEVIIDDNVPNEVEGNGSSSDSTDDLQLYSDDTKYVFQQQNIINVFYYEGDKITGHHTYIDYNDHSSAQAAYSIYNLAEIEQSDDQADRVYVKGQYLVVEYNESEYENISVNDLRTVYTYGTELKKNN